MSKRIALLSLAFFLIPTISFGYLLSEVRYGVNENKFRPSSFVQIKKIPTAFVGQYVILETEIKEVILDNKTNSGSERSWEHSYLKLKCCKMHDHNERIEILLDPTDFKTSPTVVEISKKILPIMDKPVFIYGCVTKPESSGKDVTIYVYGIRSPTEQFPTNILEKKVKAEKNKYEAIFSRLMEDGPKMLNMINHHIRSRGEMEDKAQELINFFNKLKKEDRNDINIQILETFTRLKGYKLIDKDSYKNYKGLYNKVVYSKNSEATPMLLRILKDNRVIHLSQQLAGDM